MVGRVITLGAQTLEEKNTYFLNKDKQQTLELVVNCNVLLEPANLATLQFAFIAEQTSSSDFESKVEKSQRKSF